jgi:hypothetical protein
VTNVALPQKVETLDEEDLALADRGPRLDTQAFRKVISCLSEAGYLVAIPLTKHSNSTEVLDLAYDSPEALDVIFFHV